MKTRFLMLLILLSAAALASCVVQVVETTPVAQPVSEAVTAEETGLAQLFIFSNSSPHISVIDPETNQIIQTTDLPDFTSWTWNDDNNYFDGQNLWLGLRHPDTNAVEIIALNLDTLEITSRLDLGQDKLTLYIGKATRNGVLHVGKMDSGQVAAIDTKAFEVLETWDVPTNGDVVCDADIAIGADGVERFYYPTRKGDTLVSLDVETGETLKIVDTPDGSTPLMLTTAPDNTVWVQETDSNTNAVFDPVTLELKKRFLTGEGPIVASFSADGKYGYIGHGRDTIVTVVDTQTLEEVQRIEVGTNPQKLAIHPSGRYVYAILTEEAAVAVIDTDSWQVTNRIDLGTNPTGIYLRAGSS
jgi:YVTN family beta-propeller protein